jgi:dienelactone hydrolase
VIYQHAMNCAGAVLLISIVGLGTAAAWPAAARSQAAASPEVLDVRSGALTLRAQVWRPLGGGPFPAVLFNHGSYSADDPLPSSAPETLGPVFAHHGYVFLWLHRQGTGLSRTEGVSEGDQMARALQVEGVEGRNRVQLQLLENEQMNDATAALARLRARDDVDTRRIGVVGHSFGGSLSVLMAARDPGIRAAVIFSGAAGSWTQSAVLRERLLSSVGHMSAAAFSFTQKTITQQQLGQRSPLRCSVWGNLTR